MKSRKSSMVRFLKGKIIPGQPGTVLDITVKGATRLVSLSSGIILRKSKAAMVVTFNKVLSQEQKLKAKKSLRTTPEGKAAVTIGGTQKGVRKTYASKANALKALDRRYGKS